MYLAMPTLVSGAFTVCAEHVPLEPDVAEDLAVPAAHSDKGQEAVQHPASQQPSQPSSQQPSQQATQRHQQDVSPSQSPADIGPSLVPSDPAPAANPAVAVAADGTPAAHSAPTLPQGRKHPPSGHFVIPQNNISPICLEVAGTLPQHV